jgi:inorganic pyrophosphatase
VVCSYLPVREVAQSCKTGAATNIIYGLALGYKSCIIPVFVLAIVVYIGFDLLDM